MKRLLVLLLAASFGLISCEQTSTVQAGNDGFRGVPGSPAAAHVARDGSQEIAGELRQVNSKAKTIVLRVENGMDQTIHFDDQTVLTGVNPGRQVKGRGSDSAASIQQLVGKEGSELSVRCRDNEGIKQAESIRVTDLRSNNSRRVRSRSHRSH